MGVNDPYERITFRGFRFDRMTAKGIEHIEYFLGAKITTITQGSFSFASTSGSTHAGSGAVDFYPVPGKSVNETILAGRLAGWALWHRPELWRGGTRVWKEHFHGIQIGNRHVAPAAARQVQAYYLRRDGLVSNLIDNSPRPVVVVPFNFDLPAVNLHRVRAEAVAQHKGYRVKHLPGVRRIQRALNLKTGSNLRIDGLFGPQTLSAYAAWERVVDGDGDGLPGRYALRLLGAARFRVDETKPKPKTPATPRATKTKGPKVASALQSRLRSR